MSFLWHCCLLPAAAAAAADAQSVHVTNANTWNVAGCAQVLALNRPRPRPVAGKQQVACKPINAALPGCLQLQCQRQRQWQWERYWTDRYMAINQTTLSLDFQPRRRCEKFYDSFAFAVQFLQNLHPRGVLGCLMLWTVCTAVDRIASRCVSHILEATAEVPSSAQLHAEKSICPCENFTRHIFFLIVNFGILGNKYIKMYNLCCS